jgi:hypothetical protein
VTPRGSNLLEQCRRRVNAIERRMVEGLGAKAEVIIRRWLAKIALDLRESD